MSDRQKILEEILAERERQSNLVGSEYDIHHTPNDWIAKIVHYASEETKRNAKTPESEAFRESLLKAAAVIVAALEHVPKMKEDKSLG